MPARAFNVMVALVGSGLAGYGLSRSVVKDDPSVRDAAAKQAGVAALRVPAPRCLANRATSWRPLHEPDATGPIACAAAQAAVFHKAGGQNLRFGQHKRPRRWLEQVIKQAGQMVAPPSFKARRVLTVRVVICHPLSWLFKAVCAGLFARGNRALW